MSSQHLSLYLRNLKTSGIERNIPNISEQNAEYIKGLIREHKPQRVLEIGTANGYSSLQFASVFLEDSQKDERDSIQLSTITTIESTPASHSEAVEHFKNCKIHNIHAIWGDAKFVIPTLSDGLFDFIYIDAMKREYLKYLLLTLPKMTDNALIVIDDVEKFRDKMEDLYMYLAQNQIAYQLQKTDIDDSIMIIKRCDIHLLGE